MADLRLVSKQLVSKQVCSVLFAPPAKASGRVKGIEHSLHSGRSPPSRESCMPRTAPAATTVCVIPEVHRSDGSVDVLLPERNLAATLQATELVPKLTAFSGKVEGGELAAAAWLAVYNQLGGCIPEECVRSIHNSVAQQLRSSAEVFSDRGTVVLFYTIPRDLRVWWAELHKKFDPNHKLGPRERRPTKLHWAKLTVDGDQVFTPSTTPQHRCTPSPDACAAACRRSVCPFASRHSSGASLKPTPLLMMATIFSRYTESYVRCCLIRLIQETVREKFKKSTVLIIAHRLNT